MCVYIYILKLTNNKVYGTFYCKFHTVNQFSQNAFVFAKLPYSQITCNYN